MTEYFVKFDRKTLKIKSVSTRQDVEEGCTSFPIDGELGEKFLLGTENLLSYSVVALKDESFTIAHRKKFEYVIASRVDVIDSIYEVTERNDSAAIFFSIDKNRDIVTIKYNGEAVKTAIKTAKFYFTRYNDPSFLKTTFALDVNILDAILATNKLEEWPNPIDLKIDNVRDLSIYGIKGQLKAAII